LRSTGCDNPELRTEAQRKCHWQKIEMLGISGEHGWKRETIGMTKGGIKETLQTCLASADML